MRRHAGSSVCGRADPVAALPRPSVDVFNTLPIASVVASKIFCVHGGLSPSLTSMDDIRRIQRPTDVPDYGLVRSQQLGSSRASSFVRSHLHSSTTCSGATRPIPPWTGRTTSEACRTASARAS